MGQVLLPDSRGVLQRFIISGDQPTPDEQAKINTVLSGHPLQPTKPPQADQPGILGSFARGAAREIDQSQAGIYQLLQGIAQSQQDKKLFGYSPEEYKQFAADEMKQMEERGPLPPSFFEPGASTYDRIRSLSETMGETALAMVGGYGAVMAGSALGPLGTGAGMAAAAAMYSPQMLNQNAQKQIDEFGDIKNWGKLYGSTVGQAGIEAFLKFFTLGVAGVLKRPAMKIATTITPKAAQEVVKSGVARAMTEAAKRVGTTTAAKTMAAATVTGAAEEAAQQALQRWQADMPLGDKEAQKEYLQNAIVGGILEGVFGLGVGVYGGRIESRTRAAERQAIEDAKREAERLAGKSGGVQKRREELTKQIEAENQPPEEVAPEIAGLLPDFSKQQTAEQASIQRETAAVPEKEQTAFEQYPTAKNVPDNLYEQSIALLRGEGNISPTRIRKVLKENNPDLRLGLPQARAIHNALIQRGDASFGGELGQYAKIITPEGMATKAKSNVSGELTIEDQGKDFYVSPVEAAKRWQVVDEKGNSEGSFLTKAEAQKDAEAKGLKKFKIRQEALKNQWGIYEIQKNANGDIVGRKVVNTRKTETEARALLPEYDKSYDQSGRAPTLTPEQIQAKVDETIRKELGNQAASVQKSIDELIGPGRVNVQVPEQIEGGSGLLIEGATPQQSADNIRKGMKQIVMLSGDLLSGDKQALNDVAHHEVVHALRNADILTAKEWEKLFHKALNDKVPGKKYTWGQWAVARNADENGKVIIPHQYLPEEAIAEMMRHYYRNPQSLDKPTRTLLGKLFDFIRRIAGLTRRYGGDDVLKNILGGGVATREVGSAGLGPRGYPGDPFYSSVRVDPFYYNSDKFIQGVGQNKAPAYQWLNMLKKQQNIKDEELDWLGLKTWLEGQGDRSVNKGEILDYIRANSMDMKERWGASGWMTPRMGELHDKLDHQWVADMEAEDPTGKNFAHLQPHENYNNWLNNVIADETNPLHQAALEYKKLAEDNKERMNAPLEWQSTSHRAGLDYGEAVFYLPQLGDKAFNETVHFPDVDNHIVFARFSDRDFNGKRVLFVEEMQSDLHQRAKYVGYRTPQEIEDLKKNLVINNYKLGSNIDARVKVNHDMQVLFDQIQNMTDEKIKLDYQPGREADSDVLRQHIVELNQQHNDLSERLSKLEADALVAKRVILDQKRRMIPNAPLKTTWHDYAFKRLVRYAAENGYEAIAWHGDPESVALTERYAGLFITDKGEYFNNNQNVTGVMNFYTNHLTNYAKGYFEKYGAKPYKISTLSNYPSIEQTVMDEMIGIRDLFGFSQFEENLNNRLLARKYERAMDLMDSEGITITEAIKGTGITNRELHMTSQGVKGLSQEFPTDENGNPLLDRWQMDITRDLHDAAIMQGFPINFGVIPSGKLVNMSAVPRPVIDKAMENGNFRRWFGNSKVVDEEGLPMVAYHGTRALRNFDQFKILSHFGTRGAAIERLAWLGESRLSNMNGRNAVYEQIAKANGEWSPFLSDEENRNDAHDWWVHLKAEDRWKAIEKYDPSLLEDSRMYPVFLSIDNPLRLEDDGGLSTWEEIANAAVNDGGLTQSEYQRVLFKGPKELLKTLKSKGYDGIVYQNQSEDRGSDSYIPFEKTQIKSVYNRGTWSRFDPRINYSSVLAPDRGQPTYSATAPLGTRVPAYPPPDRLAEVEAKLTYNNLVPKIQTLVNRIAPRAYRLPINRAVTDTFIYLQDRMLPVGALIDRVRKNGGFVSNENDTYLRDQLMPGQTDAMLEDAFENVYKRVIETVHNLPVTNADGRRVKDVNRVAEAIIETYPGSPKVGLSELYLYARTAEERNAVMRERNEPVKRQRPEQYHAGSGMTDTEAQEILAWFDQQPFGHVFSDINNPESLRSTFRALIKHTNDIRYQYGLTPDFMNMTRRDGRSANLYQDYAPLRSSADEEYDPDEDSLDFARTGKGYNIKGYEDMAALGRESLAINIIPHAILQNEEAIIRAKKNEVGQSFLKLLRDNPQDTRDFATIIESRPMKWGLNRSKGVIQRVPDISYKGKEDYLTVKERVTDENGHERVKETIVNFKDKRLARALNTKTNLGNAGLNGVTKMLLHLNHFIGRMNTSYNPEFMVANFLKDLGTANMNLSEYELDGLRNKVTASTFPALKNVYKALRSGDKTGEWYKTFEEFRRAGGMTAFMGLRDLDSTLDKFHNALAQDASGNFDKVLTPLRYIKKMVEDGNLAVENGVRLSTYKHLRDRFLEMTNDPTDPKNIKRARENAAAAAKRMTVNFNMGGNSKPVLNAWYLFFNASIQGSMALINPMLRSAKVKKLWMSVIAAGLAQDLLWAMFSPKDDDGNPLYDKIPEYILEHNLIFMDPWGITKNGYLHIPLPYLMNGLYNTGRAMSAGIRGKYTPGEAARSVTGTMLDSLNPFGGGGNAFFNFLAPTILDPFVDYYTNTNFAGAPIAPPTDPFDPSPEKMSQRYWNNTSPPYILIADALSKLTGSKGDYLPGAIEMSPNQIQYFTEFVVGSAGRFVRRVHDLGDPFYSDSVVNRFIEGAGDISANEIPIVRRIVGNVSTRENLTSYINKRNQVLAVRKELTQSAKDGEKDHYNYIKSAYPNEYAVMQQINSLENQRKKITRTITKISKSSLSEGEKAKRISELKKRQEELIRRGNQIMKEI